MPRMRLNSVKAPYTMSTTMAVMPSMATQPVREMPCGVPRLSRLTSGMPVTASILSSCDLSSAKDSEASNACFMLGGSAMSTMARHLSLSWRALAAAAPVPTGSATRLVPGLSSSSARHWPTAPGDLAMLGRLSRHRLITSWSHSAVSSALGAHTNSAMCSARPSSFWQPSGRSSYTVIRHLYTAPFSCACLSNASHLSRTASLHALRSGGSSFQLAWRRCSL
mmetsp:Transcript_14413/g.35771  ORF Transcript_14413/g.35771 Transcript_14413/m.35771 type:complete len:223 (-) Transcript_14413:2105-2773(-)